MSNVKGSTVGKERSASGIMKRFQSIAGGNSSNQQTEPDGPSGFFGQSPHIAVRNPTALTPSSVHAINGNLQNGSEFKYQGWRPEGARGG
ncbi:hypothetical protein TrRE_jg10772 [Triparma retinervis]|uniref:Uncharacterized protein n=1 Tax=Triparma retinervis TaxID=2557542 RepID=A0A9W6ZEA2_9STRA|nr:hypothetical protein TrRE_jg10772 [Triparma retinervis]